MIEVDESKLDIREIIRDTSKVLKFDVSDDQVSEVVESLRSEVKPEDRATLKIQGHYVRYCKEHPFATAKVIFTEDTHKWTCSICGADMTLMPSQEIEKIRAQRLNENLSQKEAICKKLGLDPATTGAKEIYEKLAEVMPK